MAEPPNGPDAGHGSGAQPDRPASARRPRWQKLLGIIGLLILLGLGILVVAGGGHGPGRHAPGGDEQPMDPPGGHAPPEGGHG